MTTEMKSDTQQESESESPEPNRGPALKHMGQTYLRLTNKVEQMKQRI